MPYKDRSRAKNISVQIRMNAKEAQMMRELAKARKQTVSAMVRELIEQYSKYQLCDEGTTARA